MTRPVSTDGIEKATGRSWDDWLEFMKSIGAQALTHAEIAERVRATGDASGWWAQTITVAFEQHIGRRVPGQSSRGDFQVSVSRTLSGDMDDALALWLARVEGRSSFDEIPLADGPQVTRTQKWRYWRAGLVDGSRIVVSTYDKGAGKAALTVSHENLASNEAQVQWRGYWKAFIADLA